MLSFLQVTDRPSDGSARQRLRLAHAATPLATALKDNGFTLVAVDGAASDTITDSSSIFYLTAGLDVDTQAESQPWGIILAASDVERTFDIHRTL